MSMRAFESVTRQAAAAVSRRASLVTLGGAALAAVATKPGVSEAKKKKSGNASKKKAKQRCSRDAAVCKAELPAACNGIAECVALLTPCCETCSAGGFVTCLVAAQQSM
jgi:hypothetical protein